MESADPRVLVYGIPNCGTVKKARSWLEGHGASHQFVDFRVTPVGRERVEAWVSALGAKALKNTSGGSYRALPDEKTGWDDNAWVAAMSADPMLIKRPVIELDGQPVMAGFRKPEALGALLRD